VSALAQEAATTGSRPTLSVDLAAVADNTALFVRRAGAR
jgi:hypothetical protein